MNFYYFNVDNALLNPLSKEEIEYHINEMAKGNTESRDKLICHHLKLVIYIAKEYRKFEVELTDLIGYGIIGLIKGIDSYNITKNIKLTTYCSKCIKNEILMFLRKNKKWSHEVQPDKIFEEKTGLELNYFDTLENEEINIEDKVIDNVMIEEIFEVIKQFSKKEQEIFLNSFGFNEIHTPISLRKLGKMYGVSYMTIARSNKLIMNEILNQLFNEDKVKKYNKKD